MDSAGLVSQVAVALVVLFLGWLIGYVQGQRRLPSDNSSNAEPTATTPSAPKPAASQEARPVESEKSDDPDWEEMPDGAEQAPTAPESAPNKQPEYMGPSEEVLQKRKAAAERIQRQPHEKPAS